ncbi:MAG: hypothetical protein Q7J12_07715 [Syntrophales bacterium]|nr:hypothetical protein [Syntrophales bacterium]
MRSQLRIRGIGQLFFIILLPVLLSMYGCGGGGGDGGGASSGITYSGITTQATINQANATNIAEGAYEGGQVGGSVGSFGAVQETKIDRPRCLQLTQAIEKAIRQIDVHAPPRVVASGATASESGSIPGSCGGTASYAVQADDTTGAFSGNITFNNFCSEGTIINGAAAFSGTININTEQLSQFTLTFQSITATSGADSFTLDGTLTFIFQGSTSFTATMEMRLRDNSTGKVYRVNNFVMTVSVASDYVQFGLSGRFYDPDYGYVDISTSTPFRINSGQNWPSQGVMILTGKTGIAGGSTKARLTVNSATTFVVDADTNGDDIYDWTSGNQNWQ